MRLSWTCFAWFVCYYLGFFKQACYKYSTRMSRFSSHDFSDGQLATIYTLTIISCTLNILGALFMILTIYARRSYRFFATRLILYVTIASLMTVFSWLIPDVSGKCIFKYNVCQYASGIFKVGTTFDAIFFQLLSANASHWQCHRGFSCMCISIRMVIILGLGFNHVDLCDGAYLSKWILFFTFTQNALLRV